MEFWLPYLLGLASGALVMLVVAGAWMINTFKDMWS